MNIVKEQTGTTLTVTLSGKLDTLTSPDLEKVIDTDLIGVKTLIFDLAKLTYISSAGLRVCLAAHKHMLAAGGSFTILHAEPKIMEVFEITGFTDIMQFA